MGILDQNDLIAKSVILSQGVEEEFPFKLNDNFGYASCIINRGFYQIFCPKMA